MYLPHPPIHRSHRSQYVPTPPQSRLSIICHNHATAIIFHSGSKNDVVVFIKLLYVWNKSGNKSRNKIKRKNLIVPNYWLM